METRKRMLARSFAHREIASKKLFDFIWYACTIMFIVIVHYLNLLHNVDIGPLVIIMFYNIYWCFISLAEFYLHQSGSSEWNEAMTRPTIGSATPITAESIDRWLKIIEENKM